VSGRGALGDEGCGPKDGRWGANWGVMPEGRGAETSRTLVGWKTEMERDKNRWHGVNLAAGRGGGLLGGGDQSFVCPDGF